MKRITIIQRILYQYRVDFYELLKERLSRNNIELQLIVEENQSQDDMDFLELFTIKKNWRFSLFGQEFICQPYLSLLKRSDLILLELGNKLLLNYLLMLRRFVFRHKKIAFGGHALNAQADPSSFRNKFKNIYLKNVDWWFPYTPNMSKAVKDLGFPADSITTIYNTTNIEKVIMCRRNLDSAYILSLKKRLDIGDFPVGIFCGRMYKEKRIDFLLQACLEIKQTYPEFVMIFIGNGEDSYIIEKAAKQYRWIKYIGPVFEMDKTAYFKLADVFLSPGLVGLSITDSFAHQVPMITTNYPYHSAEIEYLKNGENGVISVDDINSYVKEVIRVLNNKEYLQRLKAGCRDACKIYTLSNMVNRFAEGIEKCLAK